jgi:ankyrin repeat protein
MAIRTLRKVIFMTFFKRSSDKKNTPGTLTPPLQWIEASVNPWGIRLLDLRPITQEMLSTSQNPQMAANAVSYRADDGMTFIHQEPHSKNTITADISFNVDPILTPGVLFTPTVMEHKWAIFFHQSKIIFVRSWLRQVAVIAHTAQHDGHITLHTITGQFSDDDTPAFVRAIIQFLLISHVIGEVFPAPLPINLVSNLTNAGLWAFSMYGNQAHVGTFTTDVIGSTSTPLRSHSLLHIATARNDIAMIIEQIEHGIPIDLLATDGLAPLHWSLAVEDVQPMQQLLTLGADANVRSLEGATPLMNAAQSRKIDHLHILLNAGAAVNARDNRGFTAIHRAAELGYAEIVALLLKHGADQAIEAEGHTPLSLAEMRGEATIVQLLRGSVGSRR